MGGSCVKLAENKCGNLAQKGTGDVCPGCPDSMAEKELNPGHVSKTSLDMCYWLEQSWLYTGTLLIVHYVHVCGRQRFCGRTWSRHRFYVDEQEQCESALRLSSSKMIVKTCSTGSSSSRHLAASNGLLIFSSLCYDISYIDLDSQTDPCICSPSIQMPLGTNPDNHFPISDNAPILQEMGRSVFSQGYKGLLSCQQARQTCKVIPSRL